MLEEFTELALDDAYLELRRILLDMKCQFLWTIPPSAIEVRQGSWVGLSPVSMAKHLRIRLYGKTEGTQIVGIAFWPMVLIASLVVFYVACFFLLGIVILIVTNWGTISLLRTLFWPILLSLLGFVIFLVCIHIYCYVMRKNALRKIMNLMRARGSPLHRRIKNARLHRQ